MGAEGGRHGQEEHAGPGPPFLQEFLQLCGNEGRRVECARPCLPLAPSPVLGGSWLNDCTYSPPGPPFAETGSHPLHTVGGPGLKGSQWEERGVAVLSSVGARSRTRPVCARWRGHLSQEALAGRE